MSISFSSWKGSNLNVRVNPVANRRLLDPHIDRGSWSVTANRRAKAHEADLNTIANDRAAGVAVAAVAAVFDASAELGVRDAAGMTSPVLIAQVEVNDVFINASQVIGQRAVLDSSPASDCDRISFWANLAAVCVANRRNWRWHNVRPAVKGSSGLSIELIMKLLSRDYFFKLTATWRIPMSRSMDCRLYPGCKKYSVMKNKCPPVVLLDEPPQSWTSDGWVPKSMQWAAVRA